MKARESGDKEVAPGSRLPKATVTRRRWEFPIVWVVPIVAAIAAGIVVYDRIRDYGIKVSIRFRDGSGLRAGETTIEYRGVTIGEVTALELSSDLQFVLVSAHIHSSAAGVAREGAAFWIVRPQVGVGSISGLTTILTGPRIEVRPGTGPPKKQFVGWENPPGIAEPGGLKIVLLTNHLGALKRSSPVYYRGEEVGTVQDSQLSTNAQAVEIHLFIKRRFAPLVRMGSKFWNVSGLDVKLGLFRGAEINVESLRSLVSGGVAFATPDDPNDPPAQDGTIYPLYDEPKKEWLKWAPEISIAPEE